MTLRLRAKAHYSKIEIVCQEKSPNYFKQIKYFLEVNVMKKKILDVLVFMVCVVPAACGFVVVYVRAGFEIGKRYAAEFAKYAESL